MNLKLQLNALTESNSLRKLSEKISPTFGLLLQGQLRNYNKKNHWKEMDKGGKNCSLEAIEKVTTLLPLVEEIILFTISRHPKGFAEQSAFCCRYYPANTGSTPTIFKNTAAIGQ
ncbi:unnamed protein product [Pieris macdunnoughi]|uniref:Uncharacterized protein n=1 Tax=Pieris macdunnoughi TaxID=345717 RepID=A0A821XSC1_9NEOP|nr:unnamed protein product [Pieris macdunnoughi]